jgi:hypothetical protein
MSEIFGECGDIDFASNRHCTLPPDHPGDHISENAFVGIVRWGKRCVLCGQMLPGREQHESVIVPVSADPGETN